MLGNSTIIYICETQNLNIICIILYFSIFPFLRWLFPLKHIWYYFNKPTPYNWTLTFSIVNIFTIHFSFQRPINHNYSRLLFDYIAYSAKNTGKCGVFFIYRNKGKCNLLIIILLLFCLSRRNQIQDITRWFFIIVLH